MPIIQKITWAFSDIVILTQRNLRHIMRLPQLIVFSTIQPIMFMLLFTYVFGGAIKLNFQNYITYLLPGIIVQTVLFGSMQTGISLADDMSKGIVDRFRSLPIHSSAILSARTITDIVRNLFVVILMITVGFIIGFRIEHGLLHFLLGILVTLLFGFAFSWIAATIGLVVKNVEAAQVSGFIWIFPLIFASSIFVPVDTMPAWLQVFAKHTPVTISVNTVRALFLGQPYVHSLWYTILWTIAILAVFVPLAITRYKKSY